MSYPSVTEHAKLYPYTSIMAFPYAGDPTGTTNCAAAFELIKTNQSNLGTIYIPRGTFRVGTNLTIPIGMTLEFASGAVLSIDAGVTLTISGAIRCSSGQYCFTGSGTLSPGSSFSASQSERVLPPGTWAITTNTSVPANITLKPMRGAVLSIAAGITLTINGTIEAGTYQIFSYTGTGKVVFGSGTESELYPEWWGATGDGTTDDKTAIQACLDCPVNSGLFMSIKFLPQSYKILTGITISEGYCRINFNGAKIDASGMTSGYAMTVQAGLAASFRYRFSSLENLFLYGPGAATPNVTGIRFYDATNDIAQLSLRHSKVYQFYTGIDFGEHSFLITLLNCGIGRCTIPIKTSSVGTGQENISWFGGQIYECLDGIHVNSPGFGQLQLFGVSIDYTNAIAHISQGQLILNNCYIEGCHTDWPWSDYPIVVDGADAKFVMNGGSIICPESPSSLGVNHLINNTSAENVGVIMHGVYLANTVTASNELATGVGITATWDLDYANSNATWAQAFNYMHLTQGNILADGGFENTTLTVDGTNVIDAYVFADTVGATGRCSATNIDLITSNTTAHSGTYSLKAIKAGAAGTTAQFAIMAPLDSRTGRYASRLWYAKPGAETGTMAIAAFYVQVAWINNIGIPQLGKSLQMGVGLSKVFTAGAVAWTKFDDTVTSGVLRPPSWATHALILVNLDACDAGNYYFDDVYIGR